jgi:hypothetical protein
MKMQDKVTSLFQQIAQLPENEQAEIVEAVVAMRTGLKTAGFCG